jgi:hypothetical protein
MAFETKGKITAKAGNGKGFKISSVEGWINADDNSALYLAKFEKGDEVTVVYNKKGVKKICTKIMKASSSSRKETTDTTGKICECGKTIKNDKYDTCYTCSQNKNKTTSSGKKSYKSNSENTNRTSYGSPEDVAGKEVGCAANSAAAILSGRQEEPDVLLEMWSLLFDGILARIREAK